MAQIPKGIVNPKSKSKSQPRLHTSMRKDTVKASDYLKYEGSFSCEDCTHFAAEKTVCTIGYNPSLHLKEEQTRQFSLSGNMAFCRFIEID